MSRHAKLFRHANSAGGCEPAKLPQCVNQCGTANNVIYEGTVLIWYLAVRMLAIDIC